MRGFNGKILNAAHDPLLLAEDDRSDQWWKEMDRETVLGDNNVYRCVNEVADVVLGAAIALGTAADHSDRATSSGGKRRQTTCIERQYAASSGELEVEFPIIVPPPETLTSKVMYQKQLE